MRFRIGAGDIRRVPILADSGRGIRLRGRGSSRALRCSPSCHEPGGMPFRGGQAQSAADTAKAEFELDGRDVVAGVYELVVMAGPSAAVNAEVEIDPAPLRIAVTRRKDSVWWLRKRFRLPPSQPSPPVRPVRWRRARHRHECSWQHGPTPRIFRARLGEKGDHRAHDAAGTVAALYRLWLHAARLGWQTDQRRSGQLRRWRDSRRRFQPDQNASSRSC
jgi:hypothetical protein